MVSHVPERLSIPSVPRTIAEHRARLRAMSVEGGHITYVDEGPANGDIILLLHGMPTNSWMWRKLIPRLSGAFLRVIAPDMLGFGASDKPKNLAVYTTERQAQRIIALLDALQAQQVTLVVHDLGGPWGAEIIERAPERIKRVVILNTSVYQDGFNPPAMIKMLGSPLGALPLRMMGSRSLGPVLLKAFFTRFVGHREVMDAAAVEGYWLPMHEGTTRPFRQFAGNFASLFQQFPRYQAALKRLSVPAMILWGKHDPVVSYQKLPQQFARDLRIPDTRVHIFADANHFLAEDKAPELAEHIVRFVYETP